MGKALERRVCLHCGCTETPLWRSGPDGQKTLCNADGVRLKKGKLQLYLDKDGKVTANPGQGNKLYNTVVRRKETKRTTNRKPSSKGTGRVRKSSPAASSPSPSASAAGSAATRVTAGATTATTATTATSPSAASTADKDMEIDVAPPGATGGKRPLTRGASRKSEAILNQVLAESKSLHDAKASPKSEGYGSFPLLTQNYSNASSSSPVVTPSNAIASVMKEVYGCFSSTDDTQQNQQNDDVFSLCDNPFTPIDDIDAWSSHDRAEGLEEDGENETGWDLHAELNQALSPLSASLVDSNNELVAVKNAS